jgi:hypothetical protein
MQNKLRELAEQQDGILYIEQVESWVEEIVEQLESLVEYNSEQAEIYHNVEKEDAYTREMKDLYIDRVNCYGVALRIVKGGVDNAE